MTRAQAEKVPVQTTASRLIHLPTTGTNSNTCPAVPKGFSGWRREFSAPFRQRGVCGDQGGPHLCLDVLSLGAHLCLGGLRRERGASRPSRPTAIPLADSKQRTFTLKQPTSHNLICHFLHQKWSSFLWHPDNVNEMENTPSGSYHAEQNQEKDISRGRLSTFLWADETSLIMLDTLCLTSPQLTKFWLQRCCLYCHHNTECKNEMKYILTGL